MKGFIMVIIPALLCAAFVSGSDFEPPPADAFLATQWAALPDEVRASAAKFMSAEGPRRPDLTGKEFASHGDAAVKALLVVLQMHDEPRLLRDAFSALRKNFPAHAATKEYILTQGLRSPHADIRQGSLFHVGDQKWSEAREELWKRMNSDPAHRYLAANSLGELGDVRALPTLLQAVQQNSFFPRHWGNMGLNALTGKSLEDFGYSYQEHSSILGGKEVLVYVTDPLKTVDYYARRYTACSDYLKWLQAERPELYAALTPQF